VGSFHQGKVGDDPAYPDIDFGSLFIDGCYLDE
jgi:hypothetical protein